MAHNKGRKWALRAIRQVIWAGPFLSFLAGCFLVGNPFQPALLIFCTVYLGIGYIAYRRLCRIASHYIIMATAATIPSPLFFLSALGLVGGRPLGLIILLGVGYIAAWGFSGFLRAKRGLKTYLDSCYGKRDVDLERGVIDLTNQAKMAHAFFADKSVRSMRQKADVSPQEKRWFQKWGWLIALLIFITPICSGLNIAFIDEMSPVAQNFYGILIYYTLAMGTAMIGGGLWVWYFLWRRWEKENGRPMLIKYLEDRYKANQ